MRHHPVVTALLLVVLVLILHSFNASPPEQPPAAAERDVSTEIIEPPSSAPTVNKETMWACAPNRATPKVISTDNEREADITVYIFEQNGKRIHEYMTCTGPYNNPIDLRRDYDT